MWLLKLHFSISVLCLITFIGFRNVYKQTIKDNGWLDGETENKKKPSGYLIFFVPIMNVISVFLMFVMIFMKKKEFDKICEESKKREETDNE